MPNLSRDEFLALARANADPAHTIAIPLSLRLLSDQLTPVLAYRRLVANDSREAPSFLLESVEGGERQGRYSILGAQPTLEVLAHANHTEIRPNPQSAIPNPQLEPLPEGGAGVGSASPPTHKARPIPLSSHNDAPAPAPTSHIPHPTSPFDTLRSLAQDIRLLPTPSLPACVLGGWFGYAGYDTVRYAEPHKLPFDKAPRDDRALPDLHFAFYRGVVVFDHVDKLVFIVELGWIKPADDPGTVYDHTIERLHTRLAQLQVHSKPLPSGLIPRETPAAPLASNLTRQEHAQMVARAKDYIAAGDIFQVVLGQRFERQSQADPFDVYRALRTVNPSPYMVYMQSQGCILVASSPEILCRVQLGGTAVPAVSCVPPAVPAGRTPFTKQFWDTPATHLHPPSDFVGKDPYPDGIYGPVEGIKIRYRNLPHFRLPGATYFVTWRTADDRQLDAPGRDFVLNALRHFDGKRCHVYAACVMSDHVHWLVRPLEGHDLLDLVANVKHFTARELNKSSGHRGSLWQDEPFDHIVRDSEWLAKFVQYILRNPVEAKLCEKPSAWPHTWISPDFTLALDDTALGGTAVPAVSCVPPAVPAGRPPQPPSLPQDPAETAGSPHTAGTAAPPMTLTNRPLAGTRRRGSTPQEDLALEHELLSDPKERAEHIMLVDLGRNDVGMVAIPGTIQTPSLMNIERYSHVMHISSTVTGQLRPGLDCWDALRATLPVGTISGAPKIRAMQIIDELEPLRRGPYGGGMGYIGLDGQMDIALTLRTMVVPTALHTGSTWTYHLQAAGGIVADSDPAAEYQETINKAAALARAISVAEAAFS